MDNEKLKEIRNSLYAIPVLEERANRLRSRIREAERNSAALREKYEAESMDVERLEKESLSATFLRLIGKYEEKLEKESREKFEAKVEFDKALAQERELKLELEELTDKISSLRSEQQLFEAELKKREQSIVSGLNEEASIKYGQLEEERGMLERQTTEINEAVRAAQRAKSTAKNALNHLESAEKWATYDVWSRNGIISHVAKYDHIDKAEEDFHRLRSQLESLKKELADIDIMGTVYMDGIDSTTRAVDFWFDNIFTDLKVRDRIRNDADQVRSLLGRIDRTISILEKKKADVRRMIDDVERRKEELLISL